MPSFLNISSAELSAGVIIFNLVFSFILSLIIAWVYVKTHKGLSYSQAFVSSIVLVAVITATMMMVVQNNIVGALGILGVFALIRFRTIVKETRDIIFVFFALSAGVAVGTGNYSIAAISVVLISGIMFLLNKFNFGSLSNNRFIVNFESDEILDDTKTNAVFEKFSKNYTLLHAKRLADGKYEYTFSLDAGSDRIDDFIKNINSQPYLHRLDIISGREIVEY